jgi:hypothetical protein
MKATQSRPKGGRYPLRRSPRRQFHPVIVLMTKDQKERIDKAGSEAGYDSRSALVRELCDGFLRQHEGKA